MDEIQRIVTPGIEDKTEEIRYYRGDEVIAVEVYDKKGVLIHKSGAIPDGVVREYYRGGMVKSELAFKEGRAHGKSTNTTPQERSKKNVLLNMAGCTVIAGFTDGMARYG